MWLKEGAHVEIRGGHSCRLPLPVVPSPDPAREAQKRRMAVAQKAVGIPHSRIEAIVRGHYSNAAEPEPLDAFSVTGVLRNLRLQADAAADSPDGELAPLTPQKPRSRPSTSPRIRGPVRSPPPNLQPRPLTAPVQAALPRDNSPPKQRAEHVARRPATARTRRRAGKAEAEDLRWLRPLPQGPDECVLTIDPDLEASLLRRLEQLSASEPDKQVWVLVDTCRHCQKHAHFCRHVEENYVGRFERFKVMIESHFQPCEELHCELLSEDESSVRIGAFEVYLCCKAPLKMLHAATLRDAGSNQPAPQGFTVRCVASKLFTGMWPSIDAVLSRLRAAMPLVPFHLAVRTEQQLPVQNVRVQRVAGMDHSRCSLLDDVDGNSAVVAGQTDSSGTCTLQLPLFTTVHLEAWHPLLMERQQLKVLCSSPDLEMEAVAETVVQLWQDDIGPELVVYCSAPLNTLDVCANTFPALPPFQGFVLQTDGGERRPDNGGRLRHLGHPLLDADLVCCDGWTPAQFSPDVRVNVHGEPFFEIARLAPPRVSVSLATPCCECMLPSAEVIVDGLKVGVIGEDGEPTTCSIRSGTHTLQLLHPMLSASHTHELKVSGSATSGVQLSIPWSALHFVCIARAGTAEAVRADSGSGASEFTADLLLVGGPLEVWRQRMQDMGEDIEAWLWDGELQRSATKGGSEAPYVVEAGCLLQEAGFSSEASAVGCSSCALTKALASLKSSLPLWHVALTSATPEAKNEASDSASRCIISRLAAASQHGVCQQWLGMLTAQVSARPGGNIKSAAPSRQSRRLKLRTSCCPTGCHGAQIFSNGELLGQTDEAGEIALGSENAGSVRLKIDGVPTCLLPGSTGEYWLHLDAQVPQTIPLEVQCCLWVYWTPLASEEEEDGAEEESGDDSRRGGLVWVCTDPQAIQDDAGPVVGMLTCPQSQQQQIPLDGTRIGPFALDGEISDGSPTDSQCILAGLAVEISPPPGFKYEQKLPSPLAARCSDLGGCELLRLAGCPSVVGYLSEVGR